jgi:hypothetical protein
LGDLRAPVGVPGDYTVEASREIAYAPVAGSLVYAAPDRGEVHQTFHLRVDPALELSPTIYALYIQQLDSKEDTVRREAARTLATLPPAALEPLLLTFATSRPARRPVSCQRGGERRRCRDPGAACASV